ncbi:TPA: prephenate dehydratase [Candidatus Micrarchaeota archaeon]|nr:prephenate dehydratase [Candidatus Micrarchaeota archaeon]
MKLEEMRARLDRIDDRIVKLLSARMETSLLTARLKGGVHDKAREEEVLARARKLSGGILRPEATERVFSGLISDSKKLQEQNLKLAAFQGEHGAYSEMAAGIVDPSAVPISCPEFADVFSGVKAGHFDFGVVPVENSLEGAVTQVNDLLLESDLTIAAEAYVPVHHCLLALHDSDYREIKAVYSHPQALAQCRGFIERNRLEARPFYDTAGAAMMLSEERLRAAGAIASRLCAKLYGLEVVKENIEDHQSNTTRFVALAREKNSKAGNKCSIAFATSHKAGSLFSVLSIFKSASLNLTRIESRPIRSEPRKYAFLLDFQGSDSDGTVIDALEKVKKETAMYKFLGCYEEAGQVES